MSHTSGDAIDPRALQSLYELQSDSDPNLVRELIELFLRLAPERIAAMDAAIAAGDANAMGRQAHDLKSSSANLGAMPLSRLAGELETLGRKGSIEGAQELLSRLRAEYARARAALETEARRGSAR